jgi:hypothetical protein
MLAIGGRRRAQRRPDDLAPRLSAVAREREASPPPRRDLMNMIVAQEKGAWLVYVFRNPTGAAGQIIFARSSYASGVMPIPKYRRHNTSGAIRTTRLSRMLSGDVLRRGGHHASGH